MPGNLVSTVTKMARIRGLVPVDMGGDPGYDDIRIADPNEEWAVVG